MNYRTALRLRVQELCDQQNLSLYQLSALSGLPKSTLQSALHPERGNPSLSTLEKIADGFNLSLRDFFASELFHY